MADSGGWNQSTTRVHVMAIVVAPVWAERFGRIVQRVHGGPNAR